jgi:hypothetical protein
VGSPTTSRQRGPRRTVRASFPAYSSSTALSAALAPVLPLQRKPFANVTSLIRLITKAKGAEPSPNRSLTSFPSFESQVLARDSCTTRKWAPFQVGANLEPLYEPLQLVICLLRVLIPAPPTVSLAGRLPWFDLLTQGGESGLPHSRSCRTDTIEPHKSRRVYPFSARLFPGSITTTYSHFEQEQPAAHHLWFGPVSRFGPFQITRFIDDSHPLHMRNLPCPHATSRLVASS